jgi:hypothetical protein
MAERAKRGFEVSVFPLWIKQADRYASEVRGNSQGMMALRAHNKTTRATKPADE